MAAIKFNSIPDEFNGSIKGQTFYSGSKVSTLRNICRRKKHQSISQKLMSAYLIISDRAWKNLSGPNKANWQAFAIAFPQRTNKSSVSFLSGYALFVKRNQHLLIKNEGTSGLMLSPDFTEVFSDLPETILFRDEDKLFISLTYSRSNSDLDCYFSLSFPTSRNKLYANKNDRLIRVTSNSTEIIDITEDYLSIFGRLPELAESVFFEFFQVGSRNGQYFFQPDSKLIVSTFVPPIFIPEWGFFYNDFDLASIAPIGWRIPTLMEIASLISPSYDCSPLAYPSNDFWIDSSFATNSLLYSALGSGYRASADGSFLNRKADYWTRALGFGSGFAFTFNYISHTFGGGYDPLIGATVRFVKDAPGSVSEIEGNDGTIYPCVDINGLTWMQVDSRETRFNDGSPIPNITSNSDWITASMQSYCIFP